MNKSDIAKLKRVYVAGAISSPVLEDGLRNIREGIVAGAKLLEYGFAPYIPHLDFMLNLVHDSKISVNSYYNHDLNWLAACNIMLVLPNSEKSKGVANEIDFAKKHNIPIYTSLEMLIKNELGKESNE